MTIQPIPLIKQLIAEYFILLSICLVIFLQGCEKESSIIEINSQPRNASVCYNGEFELSVSASCTHALNFQWQQLNNNSWVDVGEDMPNYLTGALTSTSKYRVFVSSDNKDCKAVFSEEATITVVDSIRIIVHPSGRVLVTGDTINLYVIADGPTDLHYQWESSTGGNWTPVGDDKDVLSINNIENHTTFRVLVSPSSGNCTPVYSEEALIKVASIDKIIGHYIGVCYHERSTLVQNHLVVILYDTSHMVEKDVTLVKIVDDGFIVLVGTESLLGLTWKYITTEELAQDTISKYSSKGNYGNLAEWFIPSRQLHTVGRTSSFTYYYSQAECFYQKVE